MRVLITQSVQDAATVAAALQNRNHHALTVPVINVERTAAPVVKLEGAQGFIVTSPDGARALADTISVRTFPVFADSETTASELKRLGFKAIKAAKDDSADLAKLIEKTANPNYGALIYACSTTAPIQLSALLSNMGFAVRSLPLYSVKRVENAPPELSNILENGVDAALFLSADEARAFVALIQREKMENAVQDLKAVAANPVVAAPLRALKLGAVVVPPSADLETVFGALDHELIDKVEEERIERERAARSAAEEKQRKDEKRAKELAEKERIRREHAEREQAERERLSADQAARERLEQKRIANEKATQEKLERKKTKEEKAARIKAEKVLAAQERAERERIAKEKAVQEKAEQQRVKEEQAALAKAEKERIAHEKAERDRVAKEKAAQEKAEQQRVKEEQAAIAKAEKERIAHEKAERDRVAKEKAAQEKIEQEKMELQRAKEEREALDEARRKEEEARAEQNRLEAEVAERKRREELERAAEKAERERLAAEKTAQEQRALEKTEKERKQVEENTARERAKAERAKKEKVDKEAAAAKALAAAPALREKRDNGIESASKDAPGDENLPRQIGIVGKLKSWLARPSPPEASGPMFRQFQGEHASKSEVNEVMARPDSSDTLAPQTSKVAAPPDKKVIRKSPIETAKQITPPLPKETPDVPQDSSSYPKEESDLPKAPSSEPITAPKRGGGRAERLRAEDAADLQARQTPYKNFGIGDAPSEHATSNTDYSSVNQAAESDSSGGIGRMVALFVVLAIVATGILGTASWWVPQATQFVQGPSTDELNAPSVTATAPSTTPDSDITTSPEPTESTVQEATSTENAGSLSELTERLEALERRTGRADDATIVSMGDSLSSQARQLAAVSARLATLEAAIGNSARLEDLNDRLLILEGKSADAASVLSLSDRVTSLEDTSRRAVADQTAEVALLMATAQLREAIVAGRPFSAELETTKALSTRVLGSSFDGEEFAAHAARGIPSLLTLQNRFDETAAQTVRAAVIPDGATGWVRQSFDRLMSIVTVRRVSGDIAGNSVTAILARAENRLATGDIAGAAVEIEALTGPPAQAVAPWLADANARIAADRAIKTTLGKAMALMAVDERTQTPPISRAE